MRPAPVPTPTEPPAAPVAPLPPPPAPAPRVVPEPRVMETMVRAIAQALSGKILLLCAVVFAFILSVAAIWTQSLMSLYVLVAYGFFGILPIAYIEILRSKP